MKVSEIAKKFEDSRVRSYSLAVLGGLQGKPVYAGTAPQSVVRKRRAKNRAAKQSRKVNR